MPTAFRSMVAVTSRARRQSDDGQLHRGAGHDPALRAVARTEHAGRQARNSHRQLVADTQFNTSTYAFQFINSTFGWPAIFTANLPSGGPAYPFATPGVQAKPDPDKNLSLLLGVFNGDPVGPDEGDPETRNR